MSTTVAPINPNVTTDKRVEVVRDGKKIIIPPGMTYKDARLWLTRQEESEESVIRVSTNIACFPFDGMIALARAMEETFGYIEAEIDGFFGPQPPIHVKVPKADGSYANAIVGKISCPKWEGGYIMAKIDGASVTVRGEIKKKFEPEVNAILDLTKHYIATTSIYRSQAIFMDLGWMNGEREFDVVNDSPKFLTTGDAKLILNETVETELNTSAFMLIERTEACRANGISLKHGILLQGTFGTGKTMTAKATAKKAVANKWTFIYLTRAEDLANGLKIAKMYAPAVIFAEDIDTAVNERDADMNAILNMLDGIDTKDTPIITMLTTNNVQDIDQSFLRAGRIDTVIHYTPPDAATASRFVREIGGNMLASDLDFTAVGDALKGLVAAFIAEAISKAKRYAIFRTGNPDITGQITTEDLLRAAAVVQQHALMVKPKELSEDRKVVNALRIVLDETNNDVDEEV